MEKLKTLQRIVDSGIVAVVRTESAEKALKTAEAIRQGGIEAIEITMTVPGAVDAIRELKKAYSGGEIIVGAGTVLDTESARAAMLAGAEFFVSPHFNPDLVKMCNRYQKISMPGAMSIKEIIDVMESGADFVKFFPGSAFGPSIIKAIKGPLPYAPLVPTGGVSLENVGDWIKAGCVAVGVGGRLTKGAKTGDYEDVKITAKRFIEAIRAARG
ncbi:MAG: bifunctional 2-keto-4-hydroxyglutarate aldolase/2-keto-3-deoxy-6-phosphogluconate aldolase [Tepidanaerobacteraceae bacterium]|jgi:2-dehydro-3-deoxyphosphogluconate aldolase/(4S)-4-hydroxy-2-oxoglutarate aldolase